MMRKKITFLILAELGVMLSQVKASDVYTDAWIKKVYYDTLGNAISGIDRTYDEEGKILTEHVYSEEGIPEGEYIEYETDEYGRVTEGIAYQENGTPLGVIMTYEYDDNDNLTKIITDTGDAKQIMLYEYDDQGNVIYRKFSEGENVFLDEKTENIYDQKNRLIKSICYAEDDIEVTEYHYNDKNQVIREDIFDNQKNSKGHFEYSYS